jgi:hypothetical protein
MSTATELANQHWEFIKDLMECLAKDWGDAQGIEFTGFSGGNIAEFLYKQAFIHGYKHGEEAK